MIPPNPDLRRHFQAIYRDLESQHRKKGRSEFAPRSKFRFIYPDAKKYPKAAILPVGDVVGTYYYVQKYMKDCKLTGTDRRDGPITVQVHHLLEDRLMEHFGVRRQDGLCVAVDKLHHDYFSTHLPFHLPRGGVLYDIDVVFDGHKDLYEQCDHDDWVPLIEAWLKDIRPQLLTAYATKQVPGATAADVQRVTKFLASLK